MNSDLVCVVLNQETEVTSKVYCMIFCWFMCQLKSKLGQPLTIELQLVPSEDPLGTSAVGKPKAELNRSERTK